MEVPATYCLCGNAYETEQFMIQCDACKEWYHGGCVAVKEYMSSDFDKYHCPRCIGTFGPSLMKMRMNEHRQNYTDPEAMGKPVQTGTTVFIQELKSRHFPRADEIVKYLRGQQLTIQYLQTNSFDTPIIVESKDGLDMTVPQTNFSVYDVESFIGGDREMDVIDVSQQNNLRMKLRDFVEYFNDPYRSKVFNVISLEFTNTGLSPLVEAPYIARKLDWVNFVWPRDWPEDSDLKKPEVQKYCLMSVKDSFTDFHIDFGGTSVWYHVLRGEKIFYLIKPTPANLQLYQQWMSSSTQSETFFGDQVDNCYECILKQGQTMMIPTGWIHAVLTPVDSLVFGGNFLHTLNIPMQIQIYELERKLKTPFKFQYPCFETIHWFAAKRLLKELKELNVEEKKCPPNFLQGIKALLAILKQWNTDKDYNMASRAQIPFTVSAPKLMKELSKEIRHAERYLISLNPPKPERESKRKKKKPLNKDFVGFDDPKMTESFRATIKTEIKSPETLRPTLKLTLPKPAISPFVKPAAIKEEVGIRDHKWSLKSGKQSSTVIRFKLGSEEVVRSTENNVNIYGNFSMDPTVETSKEHTWKQTSVYDFHDGSNESDYGGFTIDEAPKRKKSAKGNAQKKIKRFHEGVDMMSDTPKNGIEELLKASAYAVGSGGQKLDVNLAAPMMPFMQPASLSTGSGRASPSTRDAIAGMLSFSEQCYATNPENQVKSSKSSKSRREIDDEDDLLLENIDKVHQDDEFIYPALDVSDEDEFIFKSKGKREDDEAWNPKARVGPLLPKTNRPAREGAKKTSVEKGLEAAAAKRAKQIDECMDTEKIFLKKSLTPKRSHKKKQKDSSLLSSGTSSSEGIQSGSYSSILTSPNRLKDVKAKLAAPVPLERKPKKGLKTAKQRLGKILKLHKLIH